MDMKEYQERYDDICRDEHGTKENTVQTGPKWSHFRATVLLGGPIDVEKGHWIMNVVDGISRMRMDGHDDWPTYHDKRRGQIEKDYVNGAREIYAAALTSSAQKDRELMLRFIKWDPRAYLYVDPTINDEQFRTMAVQKNHSVYLLLTDEQKKEPGLLGVYRDRCDGYPNRSIDPREYYSVEGFRQKYLESLLYQYAGSCRFCAMAEKINPEMQAQYDEARRSVLEEHAQDLISKAYKIDPYSGRGDPYVHKLIIGEINKYCPDLVNRTIYQMPSEQDVEKMIETVFGVRNRSGEQRADFMATATFEMRDRIKEACATRLDITIKPNSEYSIDQASLYAQIAKDALVRFEGLTEREAIDVIRSSTYEQIENRIPVKQIISDAVQTIGNVLRVEKRYIDLFESSLIDSRAKDSDASVWYDKTLPQVVLNLQKGNKQGAEQLLDKAVIEAMRITNEIRNVSSIDQQNIPTVEQIRSIEMADDLSFIKPICDSLKIAIDERVVMREYRLMDFESKYPSLARERQVEQLVDLIEKDPSVVVAAMQQLNLSPEDLAKIIESNSHYSLGQGKQMSDNGHRQNAIEIGENVEEQTPGNRD